MRRTLLVALSVLCVAAAGLILLWLPALPGILSFSAVPSTPESAAASLPDSPALAQSAETAARPYRAVWISYLEWQQVDFSSAEAFTREIAGMLDRCAQTGITVVLAQVRPFGDALYPSRQFPFSHLCTGVQGQDPGFDPLAILVEQAHARALELEAWINPYRLQSGEIPGQLAENSVAALHPDWVRQAAGGLWLSPALPEVRQYVADGVRELCEGYALDGIHFDDYFYPTTDPSFDRMEYTAYCQQGGTLALEDWRRQNVTTLVQMCCQAAHESGVRFGIAPQGNLDNNRQIQYSDVELWLREPGYLDYLMPQLYWGLSYAADGAQEMALDRIFARWQALPRDESVALYVGLGAYRIGDGDGGGADSDREWQSGHALAQQADWLARQGVAGVGLYRYDSLFANTAWPELAGQEQAALQQLWRGGK